MLNRTWWRHYAVFYRGDNLHWFKFDTSISKIEGNTAKGMLAAGLFVEGESNEIAPQDKGVLVGSSFVSIDIVSLSESSD